MRYFLSMCFLSMLIGLITFFIMKHPTNTTPKVVEPTAKTEQATDTGKPSLADTFILGTQYVILACLKEGYVVIPPTKKQKEQGGEYVLVKCGNITIEATSPNEPGTKPNV